MRIMLDTTSIIEVTNISASPCWNPSKGTTEENPEMYSVYVVCDGEGNYFGEYNLDGTTETYHAAVKNFEKICENLLTKGYCRISDFKNFELY